MEVIMVKVSRSVSNSSSRLAHVQKVASLLPMDAHTSLGQTNANTMDLAHFAVKESQQAPSGNLRYFLPIAWHSTIMDYFLSNYK